MIRLEDIIPYWRHYYTNQEMIRYTWPVTDLMKVGHDHKFNDLIFLKNYFRLFTKICHHKFPTLSITISQQLSGASTSLHAGTVRHPYVALHHSMSGNRVETDGRPIVTLIARFTGPTWGPSGAGRNQVGPMLAPWTLLSGYIRQQFGGWIETRHSGVGNLRASHTNIAHTFI